MSTAGSVPVFSGRRSLSLGDLDAMGNVVRDTANTLRSVGRTGRTGYAHASNAWYVPEPVPGVGERKDFTAEVPGLIAGAEFSGQFKRCIIEDGMLWLPYARMESMVDEDTGEELVTRHAGGVKGIEVRSSAVATLEDGVIVLPLAQSEIREQDSYTGAQYVLEDARPGLMQGVEFREDITAPCISDGVLLLPPGGGAAAPLAHFGNDVSSPVAGTLRRGEFFWGTCIAAHSGVLYFPLAEAPGSSVCSVSSVPTIPGVIKGAEIRSSIGAPCISSGVLYFPLAEDPGGSDSTGSSVSTIAGAIKGAKISDSVGSPCISSGVLVIPMAVATPEAAIPGVIKGAEVDEQSAAPYIASGVVYFPKQSSALKGLRSGDGQELTWPEVAGAAGGLVQVAGVSIRTGENSFAQLLLYAGVSDAGYLTFSLSAL